MGKNERGQATVIGSHRVELQGGTLTHSESRRRVDIETAPRIIGRSDCDLRVDDPAVSAAHCELVATERGVRLRDLTSRNGTFIDGVRVVEVLLTKPARIRLGRTYLEFAPGAATEHLLPSSFGNLESQSAKMQAVFEQLATIARTSLNVHLTGESGTGKGYIARKIHEQSKRARKPFVTIDLAQLAPSVIESALFGHEKGAFTGALEKVLSPFVEADGGSVFLDEIGDLPFELQKKLLRVIEEKMIQPVGSTRARKVDVRFISATLHNLQEKVNRKEFRDDLFYRLGSRIALPPLHERREDIGLLTRQILADLERPELFDEIPAGTLDWMTNRTWEGNLRGLRFVIEMAIELREHEQPLNIEAAFRAARGVDGGVAQAPRPIVSQRVDTPVEALIDRGAPSVDVERAARGMLLKKLSAECDGVVSEVARRAQLSRKVVRTELARLGVRAPAKPWKKLGRESVA